MESYSVKGIDMMPSCPLSRFLHRSRYLISGRARQNIARQRMNQPVVASAYGTHSMRRTKVTQIHKKTGNLRAVQLLLGHTKMDSTVRYLGVELEDALAIAEAIEN